MAYGWVEELKEHKQELKEHQSELKEHGSAPVWNSKNMTWNSKDMALMDLQEGSVLLRMTRSADLLVEGEVRLAPT